MNLTCSVMCIKRLPSVTTVVAEWLEERERKSASTAKFEPTTMHQNLSVGNLLVILCQHHWLKP